MFEDKTRIIIEDKYMELVGRVIEQLKNLPLQNLQGAQPHRDTSFANVWEAFAEELQRIEDNNFYHSFLGVITNTCQQVVQELTTTELRLLWLVSDGCLEWDEETDFPSTEQMVEEVAEELFSWVEQEAEDPQFEQDSEEMYDTTEAKNKTRH
ncbi:MAG: hypothetical protein BWK79_14155 [Beggiatoa sp. IS2]|nr:MAG: hypothetical protein BWK79_14155 [Beggiatoa sp. IS2]